jgi:UDP-glucuronate 4-epimerase
MVYIKKEVFMKVLLTGAAGFIGMHTALRLLERSVQVVGIDNIDRNCSPLYATACRTGVNEQSFRTKNWKRLKKDLTGFWALKALLQNHEDLKNS